MRFASSSQVANDFREHTRDIAEGLRSLKSQFSVPVTPAGRPTKASKATSVKIDAAPFAALVCEPADKVCALIRRIDSIDALISAYDFELNNDRRKSVLHEICIRLRKLGHPLGGPNQEPIHNYAKLTPSEIVAKLAASECPDLASKVYAYEYYRGKRRSVLNAAKRYGGDQADLVVAETAPAHLKKPPCPVYGYDDLKATPEGREAVRTLLRAQADCDLTDLLEYELATKNRAIMLRSIESAMRFKVSVRSAFISSLTLIMMMATFACEL